MRKEWFFVFPKIGLGAAWVVQKLSSTLSTYVRRGFQQCGEFKIRNASAAFFIFEPEDDILLLPSQSQADDIHPFVEKARSTSDYPIGEIIERLRTQNGFAKTPNSRRNEGRRH